MIKFIILNLTPLYFDSLLNDYGGVYPFAIAAYIAGPNEVKTEKS